MICYNIRRIIVPYKNETSFIFHIGDLCVDGATERAMLCAVLQTLGHRLHVERRQRAVHQVPALQSTLPALITLLPVHLLGTRPTLTPTCSNKNST